MQKKLSIIGIGFPKTATTWIYRCLDEHPNICMARDTRYFATHGMFYNKDEEYNLYQKDLSGYEQFFEDCPESSLWGEWDGNYIYDKPALLRIHDHYPEINVVISIRNPYDRAVSLYHHALSKNKDGYQYNNLQEVLSDDEFIELTRYTEYLKNVFEIFPENNIYIVNFDNIENSPNETIKNLYNFVRVDASFTPPSAEKKYNTKEERRSLAVNLIDEGHKLIKKIGLNQFVVPVLKRVGINKRSFTKIAEKISSSKKTSKNIEFSEEIKELFNEEIEKLSHLTTSDVKAWQRR